MGRFRVMILCALALTSLASLSRADEKPRSSPRIGSARPIARAHPSPRPFDTLNDACANAEVIPANGPFPHLTAVTNLILATDADPVPPPTCQNDVHQSVWYVFTPTATATYRISSCAGDGTATTLEDVVMAIYTGSCGSLTEIPSVGFTDGCDDDDCQTSALQSMITTQLSAGTQYFIAVWEYGSAPLHELDWDVQLRVSKVPPPVNDACAGALPLLLSIPRSGTTVGALNDFFLGSSCFSGIGQLPSSAVGRDVVYSFIAPFTANYSFRVSGYDPIANLVVYTAASCPAGTPPIALTCLAAANRNTAGVSEEVFCQALVKNQQVFVFVDEHAISDGSPFAIEVTRCVRESEPNDTPATASGFGCDLEGVIDPSGDVDFYSIPILGSRVFALVDGAASRETDYDLRVTTTTSTLEFDDANGDVAFGTLSPLVAGTPLPGTPTFLRVSRSNVPDTAEPYRLYALAQPPETMAAAESEPNDLIAQASSAAVNYFTGALSGPAPSTDVDVFRFTAAAGNLVFLALDSDPVRNNTPINAALELLDASGAVLVGVNDPGSTSNTTPIGSLTGLTPNSPGEALVYRAAASGTYYARVRIGTSSMSGTGAGDYLLSVAPNCGTSGVLDVPEAAGEVVFGLEPSRPNPIRSTAFLRYRLAAAGHARLAVYDLMGRRVATLLDGFQPSGPGSVSFDASRLSSGVYLCRLEAAGLGSTRTVLVIR